eukprot:354701-Chlamydomonas_euryale.AAC.4
MHSHKQPVAKAVKPRRTGVNAAACMRMWGGRTAVCVRACMRACVRAWLYVDADVWMRVCKCVYVMTISSLHKEVYWDKCVHYITYYFT